jgi:glc operon protein GlcG
MATRSCRTLFRANRKMRLRTTRYLCVKPHSTEADMSGQLTRASCQLIVLALTLVAAVVSTHSAFAQFAEKKKLTLAAAQKMVAAGQAEAERNHLSGVIAVFDDGGWPILVLRMDNSAYLASVELAPGKARTAARFKKPSQDLEDAINQGRTAAVTAGDFVEMQGGLPIVVDGQVVGGIGASFDTPAHDVQIAGAALAALSR